MCNFVIVTRATGASWAERVASPLCAHACATPGVGLHVCLHFRLTLTSIIVVVAYTTCTIISKQNRPAEDEAKPTPTMLCAAICRGLVVVIIFIDHSHNYHIEVGFSIACVFGEMRTLKTGLCWGGEERIGKFNATLSGLHLRHLLCLYNNSWYFVMILSH